jgi:ubiquinone/menaquinone biosynthesis C-methylase UbiE
MGGKKNFACADQQKLVEAYFHKEADFWEEIYYGTGIFELIHQRRLRIILDFIDKFAQPPHARALDVGCGAGPATVALARRDYHAYAVDAVLEMVDATRRAVARQGLQSKVTCVRGDINHLPFPNQFFSLVIAVGVLPWLPSTEAAVDEMCRVLEPGGRMILTIDNRWGLCWFVDPLTNPLLRPAKEFVLSTLGRFHNGTPRVQMQSIGECRSIWRAHGLRVLEETTVGFGPLTVFRRMMLPSAASLALHRQLQRMADRGYPFLRSAGAQYIVSAEKAGSRTTIAPGYQCSAFSEQLGAAVP